MVENIYLDHVDGFGFERVCEKVFERCGFGRVERMGGVADGGRDLIIHKPDGRSTIVECKHYLSSTVGRPVVQKLHSAVISSGADSGIIATTGTYTAEAVEHARLLSETSRTITLYDLNGLRELAERAGMRLLVGRDSGPISCMKNSSVPEISKWLAKYYMWNVEGAPHGPMDMLEIRPRKMRLVPYYVVNVDIEQTFSTSVGVIHEIDAKGLVAVFDASGGRCAKLDKFFEGVRKVDVSDITPVACDHEYGEFKLDVSTLKRIAVRNMINEHTEIVSYYGGNNVQYEKTCRPGPRSVHLNDVEYRFMPVLTVGLAYARRGAGRRKDRADSGRQKTAEPGGGRTYECVLAENGRTVRVDRDVCSVCGICGRVMDLERGALFCNDCGNFSHRPGIFQKESFRCHSCKKTICRRCSYWYRRFLLFKKKICESCADTAHKDKPKRKLDAA